MPFSDAQFAAAWTVLEDRWGRRHNAQTVKIYRDILTAELSEAQFADACRAAFRLDTFFPSPQRLIDLGTGSQGFHLQAIAAWDTCMDRMRRGEQITEPGSLERRLLNSVTHGQPLGHVETKQLDFLKKEFVTRYTSELAQQAAARTPALPGAPVEAPRVLQ